ncbi:primary-amine oxidase [Tuwongella immobilis]|uniref:Amine oxidase n=1 Tax=Tuwongella immobilis TaxID=692036 RepID=A0A6C2YTV5_9BACT|nr:primary-amine oxidase [Tuwongella immobilis]VIP04916.1 tyramine oxidase : Tyramine oxidase OS=Tolypothrix bouteillei VB521301 GN=tynA PE=4 SV=1: Cu_amine_oxidN2: Cu_amine_oxidN3: Cu_amine_oxid [Tuwongella immobilis]VTS07191.1 tyramine oxidase : Tyramine oxidase OS=Tolypothrix bouteillei VB521301 GN=tynA PE=4 SV=1: Cu_amine_oxidN2: Cu_amine_oxidN3: Cu_amine_oxid [Tuwongella immobilis]
MSAIHHPLEPLTAAEVQHAVQLLREAGHLSPTTRIVSISLHEPAKSLVHGFDGVTFPDREAFAVLFDNGTNTASEILLSLNRSQVREARAVPGVQPTMTIDEQTECEQAVLNSEVFRAALEKHTGIRDTRRVMVDIWSVGYYGNPEEANRRLARPLCFLREDPTDNGYAKPIEGLRPVVDLNTMEVIRVEEYGHWPLPPESGNYFADRVPNQRTDIRPLEITQPEGPSFQVQGHVVTWQNWSFVVGFSAREGLTLHHVRYRDQGQDRSILYRASLTEMVVPYGDPGPTQNRKNAFDVGEYGMGACANSLKLGCDCLGAIQYLDGHLVTSRGELLTIPNAICMHEEDFGILWKHTDRRLADQPQVRRSRRFVVSSVSTVENYEYGFFWYFYQDGNIQFEIKLTGILSLGAFHPGEKPTYGALIAPQLYAPNHQHFFNMRLDFDVDGVNNTVQQVDVVCDEPGPQNPFGNAFRAQATPLTHEKQARAHLNLQTARYWKIVNPNVKNRLGEPVAYKFLPGDNCMPFASPDAWWRKRAGFVNYHVWVTPNTPGENYGAGDYPNQSQGGDGLSRWTEQDRPIENTDTVFWYSFGHTHLPRPEDYPVMPTAYIGFLLKPHGFFAMNPANDVPPSAPAKSVKLGLSMSGGGSCCSKEPS